MAEDQRTDWEVGTVPSYAGVCRVCNNARPDVAEVCQDCREGRKLKQAVQSFLGFLEKGHGRQMLNKVPPAAAESLRQHQEMLKKLV